MRAHSNTNSARRPDAQRTAPQPTPKPGRIRRAYRWFAAKPPERVPWLGAPAVYATGGMLHTLDAPLWGPAGAGAALGFATYGTVLRNTGNGTRASRAAAAIVAAGGWLGAAAEFGLTGGPNAALTWGYLIVYGLGYGAYRLDDGTRKKVQARKAAEEWARLLPKWGLTGARVVKDTDTRLGFRILVDTRGTGKRASQLATKSLEEIIAEYYRVPLTRVKVAPDRIPGAIDINVRINDPWEHPIPHPMLDPEPEIDLPAVADVRQPLIIGQDPDTGQPLKLIVWDEDGAAHIVVVAIKGGGKTVLLNCILERLTAADNVAVIGIDVSKAKDLRRWRDAGALLMSACGPQEREKAVKILELIAAAISYRSEMNTEAVFQPLFGHPMIEVVIDEIDALVAPGDRLAQRAVEALTTITSKGRSESVGVILVGQRGTAQWLGGANIRANLDRFVVGKVGRQNEMNHVLGEYGLTMPNMAGYGEGHGGVMLIADISGDWKAGRTFKLKELDDVSAIAEGRTPSPLEPGLTEWLGDRYATLTGTAPPTAGSSRAAPTPPPNLDALDKEVEDYLPDDIKAAREAMNAKNAQIRDRISEPIPDVPDDQHEAVTQAFAERRRQAAEQTDIAPHHRAAVLNLLMRGPATAAQIREAIGLPDLPGDGPEIRKKNATRRKAFQRMMARLRDIEGLVRSEGKGVGARWTLAKPTPPRNDTP